MCIKNRFSGIVAISAVVVSWAMAAQESGKLIEVETGSASEMTVLTNGASFKIGDKIYRLEKEQSADEKLLEELREKRMPIRMQDLSAKDAFTMLTHLSGVTIVCARDVDQEAKVSINTQKDPIMNVIEQVCFQIGTEANFRNSTIWITAEKTDK